MVKKYSEELNEIEKFTKNYVLKVLKYSNDKNISIADVKEILDNCVIKINDTNSKYLVYGNLLFINSHYNKMDIGRLLKYISTRNSKFIDKKIVKVLEETELSIDEFVQELKLYDFPEEGLIMSEDDIEDEDDFYENLSFSAARIGKMINNMREMLNIVLKANRKDPNTMIPKELTPYTFHYYYFKFMEYIKIINLFFTTKNNNENYLFIDKFINGFPEINKELLSEDFTLCQD